MIINKWLNDSGLSKKNQVSSYIVNTTNDSQEIIVKMNKAESSRVVEELERTNPNWNNNFINSPLESTGLRISSDQNFIIKMLTNDLVLQFLLIYFAIMLIFN